MSCALSPLRSRKLSRRSCRKARLRRVRPSRNSSEWKGDRLDRFSRHATREGVARCGPDSQDCNTAVTSCLHSPKGVRGLLASDGRVGSAGPSRSPQKSFRRRAELEPCGTEQVGPRLSPRRRGDRPASRRAGPGRHRRRTTPPLAPSTPRRSRCPRRLRTASGRAPGRRARKGKSAAQARRNALRFSPKPGSGSAAPAVPGSGSGDTVPAATLRRSPRERFEYRPW